MVLEKRGDEMSDKLKPVHCGCGGEARIGKIYGDAWTVECTECGIQSGCYDTEAEAITAWNRAMGATDMNVGDKETVIIEPFTTDMNHVGYCKCGYLVNAEWKYCPNCGAKLEWK